MPAATLVVNLALPLIAGCGGGERPTAEERASIARGRAAIERFECDVCHLIPGVRGLQGHVGPDLANFPHRAYLAGKFPHDREHLVRWLMDPVAMAPATAMPAVGLDEQEARDVAAFLGTL